MVVHLIPNTLSRVLTPLHTAQRVIIRNEPAGLACHLRVYREQLNDAPAIRADLFDDRGGTRLTLAATQHREEPFDRRAKACGRLSCVIIYYDCLGAPNIIGVHLCGKRRKRLASLIPVFRQSIYHVIIIICGTPKLLVCMGDLIRHALQEFPQQLHANGGMPLQQVI